MLGFSFYKILVIIIVGLVLFKPKDLGVILYNIGKTIRKVRGFINKLKSDVEDIGVLGNPNDYIITTKNPTNNKESSTLVNKTGNSNEVLTNVSPNNITNNQATNKITEE